MGGRRKRRGKEYEEGNVRKCEEMWPLQNRTPDHIKCIICMPSIETDIIQTRKARPHWAPECRDTERSIEYPAGMIKMPRLMAVILHTRIMF